MLSGGLDSARLDRNWVVIAFLTFLTDSGFAGVWSGVGMVGPLGVLGEDGLDVLGSGAELSIAAVFGVGLGRLGQVIERSDIVVREDGMEAREDGEGGRTCEVVDSGL